MCEEIKDFLASNVGGGVVAGGREGVDTSSVFIPFMFPEMFVSAAVRKPVLLHGFEKGRVVGGAKDRGYVVEGGCGVTVGRVCAITEVWPVAKLARLVIVSSQIGALPKPMKGPGV